MKNKTILVVNVAITTVIILISLFLSITGKSIPGISATAIAIVIFAIIYTNYSSYKENKIEKNNFIITMVMCFIAMIINIISAIIRISNLF